jgi:hypothetical protein
VDVDAADVGVEGVHRSSAGEDEDDGADDCSGGGDGVACCCPMPESAEVRVTMPVGDGGDVGDINEPYGPTKCTGELVSGRITASWWLRILNRSPTGGKTQLHRECFECDPLVLCSLCHNGHELLGA